MLTHVVTFVLADPADRFEARDRLEALPPHIEALRSLATGLDILGDPGAAHLVLITTHDDVAGLRADHQHPEHVEFAAWLAPLLTAKTVVDFES